MKSPIDFPSWMVYGFPISLISIVIVWFWMQIMYLGFRSDQN
jgi:di/tricarboxylate transporter